MKNLFAKLDEKCNWLVNLVVIFLFNYLSNGWIKIESLYLDDLDIWHIYNNNSSIDFIFNLYAAKIRPVLNVILLTIFKLVGNKYYYFDFINLYLSFIIAIIICYIVKKLTQSNFLGLCTSCMFVLSHFIYYNISQVFGIMEALALIMSILLLYFLITYINIRKYKLYVYAEILYLFLPYIHERYIMLFPLFILVQIIICYTENKRSTISSYVSKIIKNNYITIIAFCLFFLIRKVFLDNQILVGTSGTSIIDSFNISQIFKFIILQILYILGFNAGESYLNGIDLYSVSSEITAVIILSNLLLIIIIYQFIKVIIKDKINRLNYLSNSLVYIVFIMLCIVSSSITIRVEMRWIYVSYTAALIFLAYMISVILSFKREKNNSFIMLIFIVLFMFSMQRETYYKSYYKNIYFWGTMEMYNSLYEETYARYEESLWNKRIIIWDNKYSLTKEALLKYFQQFNPQISDLNFDLNVVHSYNDIKGLKNENSLVLVEKDNSYGYYNATLLLDNLQYYNGQIIERSGYDLDNWVQKEATFSIYTETGEFVLNCDFPFEYDGSQSGTLYINDVEYCQYTLQNRSLVIPIKTTPKTIIKVKMDNNFSYKSEPDIRELCFLMEVTY